MTRKRHKPRKAVTRSSGRRDKPRGTLDEQFHYFVRYLDNQYDLLTGELENLLPATLPNTVRHGKRFAARAASWHNEVKSRMQIFFTIADGLLYKEEKKRRSLMTAAGELHKLLAEGECAFREDGKD